MKIFIGVAIGLFFGFMIWFPYGIFYAVQANDSSTLVNVISLLKGAIGL